jgi:hypothetical protein
MKYLPDSVSDIAFYQFDLFRSSPAYANLEKFSLGGSRFGPVLAQYGDHPGVVREIAVTQPFQFSIQTWRRSVGTRDLFGSRERVTELEMNGNTIYCPNFYGYLIDGKRVMVAPANQFRYISNSPHEAVFPEHMKRAIQEIDFSKPEVHLRTIEQPYGVTGTNMGLSLALLEGQFPLTVLIDFDYQIPINVRIKLLCKDTADAKSRAEVFRHPRAERYWGALENCTVEVNDSVVTIQTALQPGNSGGLPN